MNHDYAHCSDWSPDCPKDCFRAQLVMDLKQRTDLLGLPFTWMSFKGTSECKKFQSTRPLRDGTHGSHCLSRIGIADVRLSSMRNRAKSVGSAT